MSQNNPGQGNDEAALEPSRSVLEGLGGATWSEAEGVSYEVAIEGINSVIGAYSGLIGDEEDTGTPDADRVAAWREARRSWAERRHTLAPSDTGAVEAVRRETAQLLRDLGPDEH